MLDLAGVSRCIIHFDQKATKYLGHIPPLMKRLLFINLLILILTANVMASVVSIACSYGTSPTTVEAENLNQHGKLQSHSASMLDSQIKSDCCSGTNSGSITDNEYDDCQFHCGSPDCNYCHCTTNLNLMVVSQIPIFYVIPFNNKWDSLVPTLVKLPPHLILRPPKS